MKRRNLIASLLGMLAALPFLRWLMPKEKPAWDVEFLICPYVENLIKALEVNDDNQKLTYEYMCDLNKKAMEYKIPSLDEMCLTSHPSESIL